MPAMPALPVILLSHGRERKGLYSQPSFSHLEIIMPHNMNLNFNFQLGSWEVKLLRAICTTSVSSLYIVVYNQ